ncbi:MAG: tetratricopeptide repeat protein [Tunicatimonas sp.]
MLGEQGEAIGVHHRLAQFFTNEYKLLDSAAWYARRGFDLASAYDSVAWQGRYKHLLSYIALIKEDPLHAKGEARAAIRYYTAAQDSSGMFKGMVNLAAAYVQLGVLDRALALDLEVNRYLEQQRDWSNLVMSLNNTGIIYIHLNNPEKAVAYYKKVLTICDSTNNSEGSLNSLHNLGNALANSGEYQKAIDNFNAALEMGAILDNMTSIERAYNGVGYAYYLMGEPEQAIAYAKKSMATFDKEAYDYEDASNLHTIGMAHLALGNVEQAEKHLQLALSVAEKNGYANSLAEFQEGLYTFYEQTGDYRRAFEYLQDYVASKEKISGGAMNANINEVEADFLAREGEKALEQMETQNMADERQFRRTIGYVSASLGAALLLLLIFFQRHKMVLARNEQQLAQNKYDSLRSQMNPHFIFNTLNGVQNQILKADKLAAYQHLNRFADTIRLMLNNSSHAFVPLEVECQLIEHYVGLEQARFGQRFGYKITVDEELTGLNPLIPSMILQPIVENAIIHGLSNKREPGNLSICIKRGEKSVRCTVEDNGIGRTAALAIKQAQMNRHLSIATENTRERIALLKKFGYRQSKMTIIDLYSEEGKASGTRVHVELPIKGLK